MKPIKIDAKTRDYLRKWNQFEVPTAQVTGGRVPNQGTYRALPVIGGMEHQETPLGRIPVCGVHFILVRPDYTPFAALSLALPVTKTTELHVNAFLNLLGWDGRVWPVESDPKKWPDTSPKDVEQLTTMLKGTQMGATLTFGPVGGEMFIFELPVYKLHSPYQVAPFATLPEDRVSPVVTLERFRELAKDPTIFQVPS